MPDEPCRRRPCKYLAPLPFLTDLYTLSLLTTGTTSLVSSVLADGPVPRLCATHVLPVCRAIVVVARDAPSLACRYATRSRASRCYFRVIWVASSIIFFAASCFEFSPRVRMIL